MINSKQLACARVRNLKRNGMMGRTRKSKKHPEGQPIPPEIVELNREKARRLLKAWRARQSKKGTVRTDQNVARDHAAVNSFIASAAQDTLNNFTANGSQHSLTHATIRSLHPTLPELGASSSRPFFSSESTQ